MGSEMGFRVGLVVFGACLLAGAPADAGEVIVLESWDGERPADADRLLSPLHAELSAGGYVTEPETLGPRIDRTLSEPGGLMTSAELAEATRLADDGYARYLHGDFAPAAELCADAVARFRRSPATLAQDQGRRELELKALVGLALAHKRLGHAEEAAGAMAEVVRSFRDVPFNRGLFGPEAHDLHRAVKAELEQQRSGALRIDVDDDSVVVFLNGKFEVVGDAFLPALPPGRYRVYVQKGTVPGRQHVVDVAGGAEARLAVTWELEAALRSGASSVGFQYGDPADRERLEAGHATLVARALGATGVVVVGIREYEGRRSIVGVFLSVDSGRPARIGALAVEPAEPGADLVRALGRFLAGGEAVPGLIVPGDAGARPEREARRPYRTWKWVAGVTGVLAVAAGVTLIALDEADHDPDGSLRESSLHTMTGGIVLTAGGAVVLGTSVVLWVLDARRPGPPARVQVGAAPTAGGGFGIVVGGSF